MNESPALWINQFIGLNDFFIHGSSRTAWNRQLQTALRQHGLSAFLSASGTRFWMLDACRAGYVTSDHTSSGRVNILVFAEDEMRGHPFWDMGDKANLAMPAVALAVERGPTIIVVQNGKWPLEPGPTLVLEAEDAPAEAIAMTIIASTTKLLIDTHRQEARLGSLSRMLRDGISEALDHQPPLALVFGPDLPLGNAKDIHNSAARSVREIVRRRCGQIGLLPAFGEDLEGTLEERFESLLNVQAKERVIAQRAMLTVIIVESPGSIGELAMYSQNENLCRSLIIATNTEHREGYVVSGTVKDCKNFGATHIEFNANDDPQHIAAWIMNEVISKIEAHINRQLTIKAARTGSSPPPA